MAVDAALLARAREPVLRFYGWRPFALSLGRFQMEDEVPEALRESGLPRVRRMTGGGAILHAHELTYSLVLPLAHPVLLGAATRESYERLHGPIRRALASLGVDATPVQGGGAAAKEAFLCFHRQTPLDLVVRGRKLLGSAQRRTRGFVLQHGSLILRAHPLQPGTAALDDLLRAPLEPEELCELLTFHFAGLLGPFEPGTLTEEEVLEVEARLQDPDPGRI
jgi:lipoate-protein ligase A